MINKIEQKSWDVEFIYHGFFFILFHFVCSFFFLNFFSVSLYNKPKQFTCNQTFDIFFSFKVDTANYITWFWVKNTAKYYTASRHLSNRKRCVKIKFYFLYSYSFEREKNILDNSTPLVIAQRIFHLCPNRKTSWYTSLKRINHNV